MRKKKPEEHENMERWLVSYADFITLLFAFFTTMYAISTVDAKKMGRLVLSMQAAFDPTGFSTSRGSTDIMLSGSGETEARNSMLFNSFANRMPRAEKGHGKGTGTTKMGDNGAAEGSGGSKIREDLSKIILDDALRDKVQIIVRKGGVIVSLAEAGFFDSGSHQVRRKSLPLVDKIAAYIKRLPNAVRVTGHTDDRNIHTARFSSNWDLSTARATHMVSYLITKHGIDPKRLSAAGYAEYHPVASNATAEGRARNRRVDIFIPTSTIDPDAM